MGLLDVLNGMQNGPRGQPQPSAPGSGGMSKTTMALLAFQQVSSGQTPPPMGGGYTNVTSIPVNDPAIKAIGGALFKPAGAGPFPAVVYMTVCGGVDGPLPRAVQKTTTDHLLAKGVAILIVDSFTPRGEPSGVCANLGPLDEEKAIQYAKRGSDDALAAVAVLKAMPERTRFVRGLRSWSGFRQVGVAYERSARHAGPRCCCGTGRRSGDGGPLRVSPLYGRERRRGRRACLRGGRWAAGGPLGRGTTARPGGRLRRAW